MRMRRGSVSLLGLFLGSALSLSASLAPAADVNELYKLHCVKCHGAEGKGDGESLKKVKGKAIDWTSKAEMAKLSNQDLLDIIWQGGGGVGKSKIMPAYKGKLKDDEAKELATFVRSFVK